MSLIADIIEDAKCYPSKYVAIIIGIFSIAVMIWLAATWNVQSVEKYADEYQYDPSRWAKTNEYRDGYTWITVYYDKVAGGELIIISKSKGVHAIYRELPGTNKPGPEY
jgi:hypothetical protein